MKTKAFLLPEVLIALSIVVMICILSAGTAQMIDHYEQKRAEILNEASAREEIRKEPCPIESDAQPSS